MGRFSHVPKATRKNIANRYTLSLLSAAQVGRACGMSRRAAKNMLRGAGVLEQVGSRWFVGEARLRGRLPDVYDRVFEYFVMGTL